MLSGKMENGCWKMNDKGKTKYEDKKELIVDIIVLILAFICLPVALHPMAMFPNKPFLALSGVAGLFLGLSLYFFLQPAWLRQHKKILNSIESLRNDIVLIMKEKDPRLVNFVNARFKDVKKQVKKLEI